MNSEDLVNYLINTGVLGSPKIIEAFKNVDRMDFVKPENKSSAYQ
jgi:protein-L-isoaspartate O-methyltransferase